MSSEMPITLREDSPSVQAHLVIIQNVIQRMAENSSACKTWCITVVSAILVIVADKGKPDFAYIALIPTILFLALDTFYLGLEKSFRASYNQFVKKIHDGIAVADDLYAVSSSGSASMHQFEAIKSFSIWGFYAIMLMLILLAKIIVITPSA